MFEITLLSESSRHDIEMMLWGAALMKITSDKLLKSVDTELLSADTRALFESLAEARIAKTKTAEIAKWLALRSVKIEPGEEVIDVIVRRLSEESDRARCKAIVARLHTAGKISTRTELLDQLKMAIKELE